MVIIQEVRIEIIFNLRIYKKDHESYLEETTATNVG